jgi:hypothetical protein
MSTDYLMRYMTEAGFDFPRLLNDDFFQPVRILYNARHYVSANKLLLVAVDSMGFIEYGNSDGNTFIRWLESYADLRQLGITAGELWEQRNSLLHMSNLDSRKVLAGKVRRLFSYVGTLPAGFTQNEPNEKHYSLMGLIQAVADGCSEWSKSYNVDRAKFETFLDRYDLIVSDSRMEILNADDQGGAAKSG